MNYGEEMAGQLAQGRWARTGGHVSWAVAVADAVGNRGRCCQKDAVRMTELELLPGVLQL